MPIVKRFVLITVATLIAVVVAVIAIEVGVRARWDPTTGTPGFYLTDPVLGQRLAPGYSGWFAGVPVRINNLGFRDPRDFSVDKGPGVFRILVLGDSVTFGHGTLDETTYPYLLEQRLTEWRPEIDWQVWNLAVPGYNTRQELLLLEQVGRRYDPDLVVVGFFPNDFQNNEPVPPPSVWRRGAAAAMRVMQRRLYSFEFYKRVLLTARWRLMTNAVDRQRLEHLATEQALLAPGDRSQLDEQRLTPVTRFDGQDVASFVCEGAPVADTKGKGPLRRRLQEASPEVAAWLDAVKTLQMLHHDGRHRVVFFINMAPGVCGGQDRFYDNGILDDDDVLLDVLGNGTPAVSSTRAFLHYRPSQMPAASGHAVGNSNAVKADVLFQYLRDAVLPPLVTRPPAQ